MLLKRESCSRHLKTGNLQAKVESDEEPDLRQMANNARHLPSATQLDQSRGNQGYLCRNPGQVHAPLEVEGACDLAKPECINATASHLAKLARAGACALTDPPTHNPSM